MDPGRESNLVSLPKISPMITQNQKPPDSKKKEICFGGGGGILGVQCLARIDHIVEQIFLFEFLSVRQNDVGLIVTATTGAKHYA